MLDKAESNNFASARRWSVFDTSYQGHFDIQLRNLHVFKAVVVNTFRITFKGHNVQSFISYSWLSSEANKHHF